jgi:hypothetical protein
MTFALRKMICLIAGFGEHDSQTKMLLVEHRMFIQTFKKAKEIACENNHVLFIWTWPCKSQKLGHESLPKMLRRCP